MSIFSLVNCDVIGVLNRGVVNIPDGLKPLICKNNKKLLDKSDIMKQLDVDKSGFTNSLNKPVQEKNKRQEMDEKVEHNKKRLHYQKYNAVPEKWNPYMKESHIRNSSKFGSDVLKSLWNIANHSNDSPTDASDPCVQNAPPTVVDRASRINLLSEDSTAF